MTQSNFDDQITLLTEQIDSVCRSMEKARALCLDEAKTFVISWGDEKIHREVKNEHEITKKNGVDKLREMKKESAALKEDMQAIIDKNVGKPDSWPHLNKQLLETNAPLHHLSYDLTKNFIDAFEIGIRKSMGCIGEILIKYGYGNMEHRSEWKSDYSNTPCYAYGIHMEGQLKVKIDEYKKCMRQYFELSDKLSSTKRSKAEHEAQALWDQA